MARRKEARPRPRRDGRAGRHCCPGRARAPSSELRLRDERRPSSRARRPEEAWGPLPLRTPGEPEAMRRHESTARVPLAGPARARAPDGREPDGDGSGNSAVSRKGGGASSTPSRWRAGRHKQRRSSPGWFDMSSRSCCALSTHGPTWPTAWACPWTAMQRIEAEADVCHIDDAAERRTRGVGRRPSAGSIRDCAPPPEDRDRHAGRSHLGPGAARRRCETPARSPSARSTSGPVNSTCTDGRRDTDVAVATESGTNPRAARAAR